MRWIILLLLCGPAVAQQCTTLVYQGAPFNSLITTGPNSYQIVPLTGTVTLAEVLPANGITAVVPVDWEFPSEWVYLNLTSYWPAFDTYSFSFTTQNGIIVDWQVSANYNNGGGVNSFSIAIASTAKGDSVVENYWDADSNILPASITGISANPGTWSCKDPPDPLVAQVTSLTAERNIAQENYAITVGWLRTADREITALKAEIERLMK